MDDGHAKAFKLIHATVKTPGKRGSKPSHHCKIVWHCVSEGKC